MMRATQTSDGDDEPVSGEGHPSKIQFRLNLILEWGWNKREKEKRETDLFYL
jgi:hypothetical protein